MIIPEHTNILIKGRIILLDKYDYHQAIEYARQKLGMGWDDNRQRLSFCEKFMEYLEEQVSKAERNIDNE